MADQNATVTQRGTQEHMYEGMFLLESGRFASDPDGATNTLLGLLSKLGATVEAHRLWQDGKLAYEIEGHRRGVHYLALFRMPAKNINDLNRACKLSDLVLRHLVIAHDPTIYNASLHALSGAHEEEEGESAPQEQSAAGVE